MAKRKGSDYIQAAEKSDNVRVKNGKGDHVKIYCDRLPKGIRNPMIIPMNLKGDGTERAIVKWFTLAGIIMSLVGACGLISNMSAF